LGRSHLLTGSYFVVDRGKVMAKLFIVFDSSGRQHKRQTADTDAPELGPAQMD
jgi:hypothetical protein